MDSLFCCKLELLVTQCKFGERAQLSTNSKRFKRLKMIGGQFPTCAKVFDHMKAVVHQLSRLFFSFACVCVIHKELGVGF